MSDWDEIKRLAADFQKVQLTSTLQKLSERNCIEIVALLLEKKLVDVIYTTDGKEYITPDHLEREIIDELYINGGRVNLVELAKTLTVDLSRIETIAEKIAKEDDQTHFMLGQLINEDYIVSIAQEINEKLAHNGEISVSDLTVQFDLPSDFLQANVMEKHLNKIIKGRQDPSNPRIFFTQAYITRCKCKIRGALAALTRPTNVAAILQQINVQEKIFHTLLEEISPAGNVTSKLSNAQYVPHLYAKMQTEWVTSFYKQNGFLEYDAITKVGISEPRQFIKKHFANEEMVFLKRCAVGSKIIDLTLVSALTECSATKSYVDLSTILPSNMSEEDIEELFNSILLSKNIPNNFIYLDTTVFSKQYLTDLINPCNDIANINAKAAIDSGAYQQYIVEKQLSSNRNQDHDLDQDSKSDKRDERRKKASSGKGGGGTQGRETKTKSTKKHHRGGDKNTRGGDSDDDEDVRSTNKKTVKALELIKRSDIEKVITKKLEEEGLEHLNSKIAGLYLSQLNQAALQAAQVLFEATPQTNRRQTHASLQDKLNTLLVDIRLYEKGLKLLPADSQSQLIKYLLKSLGNDICNELTIYVANECNLNLKSTNNLNIDQRNKIAQECDPEYKTSLLDINKALNKTLEEFLVATESALKACSMIVKKVDKKKDRSLILEHRHKLCQQLQETDDPALVLHLVALVVFTTVTGNILHASGKFVSQILSFLQPSLSAEQNALLMKFHDLVLKFLQAGSDSDEGKLIAEELNTLQKSLKEFASTFEKAGVTKAE